MCDQRSRRFHGGWGLRATECIIRGPPEATAALRNRAMKGVFLMNSNRILLEFDELRIAAAKKETNSKVFRVREFSDEPSIPSVISYGKCSVRKRYLKQV